MRKYGVGVWGRERVLYVLYVMLEHYITTHTSYSLLAMKWIFFLLHISNPTQFNSLPFDTSQEESCFKNTRK